VIVVLWGLVSIVPALVVMYVLIGFAICAIEWLVGGAK